MGMSVLKQKTNGDVSRYRSAEQLTCVADPLQTWFEMFPRGNFLFLNTATMFGNVQDTMDRILDFVGMPAHDYSRMSGIQAGRRRAHKYYDKDFLASFHAD